MQGMKHILCWSAKIMRLCNTDLTFVGFSTTMVPDADHLSKNHLVSPLKESAVLSCPRISCDALCKNQL
jgi:hypothetical protein